MFSAEICTSSGEPLSRYWPLYAATLHALITVTNEAVPPSPCARGLLMGCSLLDLLMQPSGSTDGGGRAFDIGHLSATNWRATHFR